MYTDGFGTLVLLFLFVCATVDLCAYEEKDQIYIKVLIITFTHL